MIKESLLNTIDQARDDLVYETYLEVRERVLEMIQESKARDDSPSDYWAEELAGFEYMLDASPLIVQKLREHCHHITGIRSYEYRRHHSRQRAQFVRKLDALRDLDRNDLFVPESPALGGFGHEINGQLVNIDTLKFYEILIGLDNAGFLNSFREDGATRRTVLEIGAGWGGFGFQFKTLFPKVRYVIIDLPSTLLFSALYVRTLFPETASFVYGDGPLSSALSEESEYDFIFLPHYVVGGIEFRELDLAINMVSFQEMTSEQVAAYARITFDASCQMFYSLNRDRSRYNDQLSSVSMILRNFYELEEIEVLPVQYTSMDLPEHPAIMKKMLRPEELVLVAKRTVARALRRPNPDGSKYRYRHLAGRRKATMAESGT